MKTISQQNKSPCPRCGKKDVTIKSGNYTMVDCDKCTYWFRRIDTGSGEKATQGEWSRHRNSELEANSKDVLQPRNRDGTINKNFVKVHGTKLLEKELKMSKQEIINNAEKYT